MKFDFDTFEFTGLIAPGSVLVIAIAWWGMPWPRAFDGPVVLGVLVLASYVFGHLVAAIGNYAEERFRLPGIEDLESLPSINWLQRGYYSKFQEERLSQLFENLGWMRFNQLHDGRSARRDRRIVAKQLYQTVATRERLDTFSGLANLSRGLATSFAIVAVLSGVTRQYAVAASCVVAVILMMYRLKTFRDSYSRELIQLALSTAALISPRKTKTEAAAPQYS